MVDPSLESREISSDYVQFDWIEGTRSRGGAHVVKLAPEPILSGESCREVEQFGKFCESEIQWFCLKRPSRNRHQRFRFRLRKVLWKRDRGKVLVELEL